MNESGKVCECKHHKVPALAIILIGLSFLLGTLGVFSSYTVGIIWPVLVIIAGITKLGGCKCC